MDGIVGWSIWRVIGKWRMEQWQDEVEISLCHGSPLNRSGEMGNLEQYSDKRACCQIILPVQKNQAHCSPARNDGSRRQTFIKWKYIMYWLNWRLLQWRSEGWYNNALLCCLLAAALPLSEGAYLPSPDRWVVTRTVPEPLASMIGCKSWPLIFHADSVWPPSDRASAWMFQAPGICTGIKWIKCISCHKGWVVKRSVWRTWELHESRQSITITNTNKTALERRKTLGHLRSINRNMIIHFANQSQTCELLKKKKKN